jgi:imidazolonepropionase
MKLTALHAARLVTLDPMREGLGVLEDAALAWDELGVLAYVGPAAQSPAVPTRHATLVTPGLVDAHTHLAYAGSRHDEYALRLQGAGYEELQAAGGGILSSARAVADCTEDQLVTLLCERLARMASLGVTRVEVKSGYGLTPEHELKQLRAIARVHARHDLPAVIPTFLALHALPPNAAREDYVRTAAELVTQVGREALAEFVDVYVDRNAFTVAEATLVADAAQRAGLGLRAHVGQFADVGGAAFAAEHHAASVDHLEHVDAAGAKALAAAGTVAVLLPVASFTLGQAPPPVQLLRDAGVELAVATDANPGTAPTESLPLAMAFAARSYGMSSDEIWRGVTRAAARSLRGAPWHGLAAGAPADLVAWDVPHERALLQPWGVSRVACTLRQGRLLYST